MAFGKETDNVSISTAVVETVVGAQTKFKGTVNTDKPIKIQGKFEGTIESSNVVVVEQTGYFEGTADCREMDLAGEVNGKVLCSDVLKFTDGGKFRGEAIVANIDINPGAKIGEYFFLSKSFGQKLGFCAELSVFRPYIQFIHSPFGPFERPGLDTFDNFFGYRSDLLFFLRREFACHKIDLLSLCEIVAYSYPGPGEILGACQLYYVLQPVMASVTAFFPKPYRPEFKVKVIAYYHKVLLGNRKFAEPVPDGIPAQVHIC